MKDASEFDTAEFFLPLGSFDTKRPQSFSSEIQVEFGAVTDKGKKRLNNEDAFVIFRTGRYWQKIMSNLPAGALPDRHEENAYAMAVADGMGGLAAGEVASSMVLTTMVNLMLTSVKWALKLDHPEFREKEIREGIERGIEYLSKADTAIENRADQEQSYKGMGTTFTASYTFGDDLFVLHVGDSRAYLYRNGKLSQITHDHTVAQELADRGDIPQSAVEKHRLKHILTRSIGHSGGKLNVEVHHLKLENNDLLLLCTDGLNDMISDEQISAAMSGDESIQERCQALTNLALQQGGKDNITVVMAKYEIPQHNLD
jgi:protein phosphatase